jgi:AmmeMemoRadiSam system protein B/AmmeMemoRadiSam system protein A
MPIPAQAIRNPAAAGRFYPDDPLDLKRQIQTFIDEVTEEPVEGDVLALVVPHAGYVFSGSTAAASFKYIADLRVDTVFVLSPSHFDPFQGVSVYTGAGYRTPLGVVPIDQACARSLVDYAPDVFSATELGHREEHGIEVELPFLQVLLSPSWQLVPIVMAERSSTICRRTAEAILSVSEGKQILVIASSDLYHGYEYEACHASDERTLQHIEQLDPEAFIQGLETEVYQACGGGPIAVAIHIALHHGPCHTKSMAHTTSADISGRRSGYMVGYGAVAIYKVEEEHIGLNDEERRQLLTLARTSIEEEIGAVSARVSSDEVSDQLQHARGIFVTLRFQGQLRGCIGQVQTKTPLYETVCQAARSAATHDPRFQAVTPEELNGLTISISILSPFTPTKNKDRIQIGRDGLYIRRADMAGLLLPQVAEERSWDAETFLAQTCQKAGLWPSAWQEPETEIFVFTTEEFGEKEA